LSPIAIYIAGAFALVVSRETQTEKFYGTNIEVNLQGKGRNAFGLGEGSEVFAALSQPVKRGAAATEH